MERLTEKQIIEMIENSLKNKKLFKFDNKKFISSFWENFAKNYKNLDYVNRIIVKASKLENKDIRVFLGDVGLTKDCANLLCFIENFDSFVDDNKIAVEDVLQKMKVLEFFDADFVLSQYALCKISEEYIKSLNEIETIKKRNFIAQNVNELKEEVKFLENQNAKVLLLNKQNAALVNAIADAMVIEKVDKKQEVM